MKNKGVLILGSAVVLLALYAYFGEYQREIKETEKKETEDKVVQFKKDQIQKIEFNKGEGTQIVLERTLDGWNIVKPVADQGDNETTEAFLDQITGEKIVDRIPLQKDSLGQYGFSPSLGTVVLINNEGKKQQIEVSNKKNFEGLIFLRRDQENTILTSSETWMTFLTKPSDQFRNLKFYRGLVSKVHYIKITNSAGSFELKSTDGQWKNPAHPQWKLDQNVVRDILSQLSLSKGTSLVPAAKGKHLFTLELGQEDKKWKGTFTQDSKSPAVWATMSDLDFTLMMPPQTLENLRHMAAVDVRDKTEPFQFDVEDVQKIIGKTSVKSFILVKNNNTWNLEKPDPMLHVNSDFVQALPQKLKKLKVYRFFEKQPKAPALDAQIELQDVSGKTVFQMSWSGFKDHEGFAKTNLYGETFLMDDAQINQLMLPDLVKPAPSPKEEKVENDQN